jgi:DNA mismatch repair ATPase MutS
LTLLVVLLLCRFLLFQSWLKAPLVDPAAIRQRLDVVDALVADQALREGVRDALRGE